jgi:hypothetical protein
MGVKEDPVLTRVKDVIKNGKLAIGQQSFIDLLYGDSLTTVELIRAFCYDCRAWYADGIGDCKDYKCPLYSKMPYATMLPPAPARARHSGRIRNPQYPTEKRLHPLNTLKMLKSNVSRMDAGKFAERKMRKRKYPQEITQKEITMEERSIAMFDTAVKTYEQEKKEKAECKEQK